MKRRVITAADVRALADEHRDRLLVGPADIVTPLARDDARQLGITIELAAEERSGAAPTPPRVVRLAARGLSLPPFTAAGAPAALDVRLRDIVTAAHGSPMAAGFMSLREGRFPWTLDYDEIDYVVEGELHIETAEETVIALPGEIVYIPKGSSISFATPTWAKFLYVTFPVAWSEA